MRKNLRFWCKVLAISAVLTLVLSGVALYAHSAEKGKSGVGESRGGSFAISLVPPSFVSVAGAAETTSGEAAGGGGAFPEDEAGLCAYINTHQTIDIEKVKTIFSEVEEVGDNYIIGVTNISDFGGDIDVHVYADTDGWIVAYFTKDEPAAKIMQWGTADVDNPVITTITTTTLRDALYKAGDAAGIGIPSAAIKYYDFEYPNANGMTLFVRTRATDGTNITQVEIPADYILYEASYYHYIYYYAPWYPYTYWDSKLRVDTVTISDAVTSSHGDYKWWRAFGSYKGAITTGTLHKIEISYEGIPYGSYSPEDRGSAGVATVLIYKTG